MHVAFLFLSSRSPSYRAGLINVFLLLSAGMDIIEAELNSLSPPFAASAPVNKKSQLRIHTGSMPMLTKWYRLQGGRTGTNKFIPEST